MNQEIIQAIAGFLGRVTLQASEIEAYQACMAALQEAFNAAAAPLKDVDNVKLESAEVS